MRIPWNWLRAVWAVGILWATAGAVGARPPNIVFILADDLGINDLGCYGRSDHFTPHLDRLAEQGTRFTSAYCAQPICSPSRAAIMTGRHPARLHLTTYLPGRKDCAAQPLKHPVIRQHLPLEERTLAERLQAAGYATACVGKWHLGGEGFDPAAQGFDFVHAGRANTTPGEGEGGKGEFDLTAQAVEFITAQRDRPFFLYLPHHNPHIPYRADPNLVQARNRAFEPVYAALIETLDIAVGRLLSALDELGLTGDTLVIFTSDNGGLHVPEGEHPRITHNTPFRAGKGYLYEGGTRIPLIVRWPGRVPAGRVVDSPVSNLDWVPTLQTLAGLPRAGAGDVPLDGRDLSGLLLGRRAPERRTFYWHFPHYTNQGGQPAGAVREGDWKLIEHYEKGRLELFHLADDQGESRDLVARYPRRAARLKRRLDTWRAELGAQTNTANSDCDRVLHDRLYVTFVPSRFDPRTATEADWLAMAEWRQAMDAVVK